MNRTRALSAVVVGAVLLCGSIQLGAQQAATPVPDPITPAECLRDKKRAPDCLRLGQLYAAGNEVPQDIPKALGFLDAACRARVRAACVSQGWLLLKHHAGPEDVQRGVSQLRRLCEQQEPTACSALGSAYVGGIGVERDVPAGVPLLESACQGHYTQACFLLGVILETGDGVPADVERAKPLLSRACQGGHFAACERACMAGDGNTCRALHFHARSVNGADAPDVPAILKRACDAGVIEACDVLAWHTADGAESLALFEHACRSGFPKSCDRAAWAYYQGRIVGADLSAAVRLFTQACEAGVAESCRSLGGIYARGEQGTEAVDQGWAYLLRACAEDATCQRVVSQREIPAAWGGSLEILRGNKSLVLGDQARLRSRGSWVPARGPGGAVRVGGRIAEPRKIKHVSPAYPPLARRSRIQGTVAMECVIDVTGAVKDIRVIGSVPILDGAAIEAVRQWRYAPTLIDGEPVPVIMMVTVSFRIS